MTLLLTTVGCAKDEHKDKQQHDCGCESEALSTVSTVGEIYFKTQVEPDDDYYNDNFWIIEKFPGSIENHYVVCNEEITKNEFDVNHLDLNWEVDEVKWVSLEELENMGNLHFGIVTLLEISKEQISQYLI